MSRNLKKPESIVRDLPRKTVWLREDIAETTFFGNTGIFIDGIPVTLIVRKDGSTIDAEQAYAMLSPLIDKHRRES